MTINVQACAFCPDDCPYFVLKEAPYYEFNELIENHRTCENEKICEFAVQAYIKSYRNGLVKEESCTQ